MLFKNMKTDIICWVRIIYWGEGYGCGYDFSWTLGDSTPLNWIEDDEVKDALADLGEELLRTDRDPGWPRSYCFTVRKEDPDLLYHGAPIFYLSREIHPPLWVKRAFRRYLEVQKNG